MIRSKLSVIPKWNNESQEKSTPEVIAKESDQDVMSSI